MNPQALINHLKRHWVALALWFVILNTVFWLFYWQTYGPRGANNYVNGPATYSPAFNHKTQRWEMKATPLKKQ